MCGDNPPKLTNVIDVSEWDQIIQLCFDKEHSLHFNRRDNSQIPWIVWIPDQNSAILKICIITEEYNMNELKKMILNELTVQC